MNVMDMSVMHSSVSTRKGRVSGFSLIEVLITTVVLSIGILGVGALHAVSKQAGFESVQRSTASQLAYGLFEDMRANRRGLNVYLDAGTLGRGSRGTSEPSPTCSTAGAGCTAEELAIHSLWRWEQMLDTGMEQVNGAGTGGLVTPSACITAPAGGGAGDYVVTIVWRGVAELVDAGTNDCGDGTGLYGDDNEFRRMVVIRSYIDPTI